MIPESLIAETAHRFPRFARSEIEIVPLEKGGSDRKYYRIKVTDLHSLILVKYGDQREENRHYVTIAQFLKRLGIGVPEIYFHDTGERLIWMEDLGECDLWSYRNEAWSTRQPLYQSALDQVADLHTRAHSDPEVPADSLQPGFDLTLYRWEQNYFFENCLTKYFGIAPAAIDQNCDRETLEGIAHRLSGSAVALIHRDFQSQNILVRGGETYLIDFQGLRHGLVQYDLASLLYDPYVALDDVERMELLDYYLSRQSAGAGGGQTREAFLELFHLCALQRLMQALGAYGFLGLVKGKTQFLPFVAPALSSLKAVVRQIPGLDRFGAVLDGLPN